MAATPADSLTLELTLPSEVRAGEPVRIALRARNVGSEPLELYLRGRPVAFDITVARADGTVVWRRLERQTIPTILQVWVLAAGQSLELSDEWDQRASDGAPADPGYYTVTGALLTVLRPLETAPAPLRIPPGDR